MNDLLLRTAQQIGVSFPKRIIELVVAPYDEKTLVSDRGPRPVFEHFVRGAFDGIQRRANRIKTYRDHHDERSVVGRAIALHPSREEGLVAEVQISKTLLGDETLTLADDEVLDASAGYLPMPDGETWNRDRSEVKIHKAWLGHIALVPEPYEGARVLAVRHAAPAESVPEAETPNLALVRSWQLQEEYDRLSRYIPDQS
jgi:phage head maturation protease